MVVFGERGKPEDSGKNLLVQSREPTNKLNPLESRVVSKDKRVGKYAGSREAQNTRERRGAGKFYLRIYFSRFYTLSEIKGYSSFKSSFQIWQKNCCS